MGINMSLKLKSWIYRRTGIYLAKREEQIYIKSEIAQRKLRWLIEQEKIPENDAKSILISIWQLNNGFRISIWDLL